MDANMSTPVTGLSKMTPDDMRDASSNQSSRKSSISSQSSGMSASSIHQAAQSFALSTAHAAPASQLDPLSRDYPQPTGEVDVSEMLNRKPMKWSVGHYIKETPSRTASSQMREDKEEAARQMEARKRELLKAKEEMRQWALSK